MISDSACCVPCVPASSVQAFHVKSHLILYHLYDLGAVTVPILHMRELGHEAKKFASDHTARSGSLDLNSDSLSLESFL